MSAITEPAAPPAERLTDLRSTFAANALAALAAAAALSFDLWLSDESGITPAGSLALTPGLVFALIARFGSRVGPGLLLGSLLFSPPFGIHVPAGFPFHLLGRIAIPWGAAMLARRHFAMQMELSRPHDLLVLGGMLMAVSTASSLILLPVEAAALGTDAPLLWTSFFGRALGSTGGAAALVPALLLLGRNGYAASPRPVEFGLFALAVPAVTGIVFLGSLGQQVANLPFAFLVSPILVWGASRLGPLPTALAGLAMALGAAVGTVLGTGPFADHTALTTRVLVTTFVLSVTTPSLLFAVLASELRRTGAEIDEASRRKSRFLAVMNHELRTPLNAVVLATDLLEETPLTAEQARLTTTTHRAAATLLEMIRNSLDLVRLEEGRTEIQTSPFSPRSLLDDLDALFSDATTRQKLSLRIRGGTELPASLYGDRIRIKQILVNLVGNALKFTEKGGVEVHATAQGSEPVGETRLLRVDVTDTGCGITEAQQERLFEAFYQADSSNTRTQGGAGMGLAIACQLAERMGGSLRLVSSSPDGSCFRLEVPCSTVASDQSEGNAAAAYA